MQEIDRSTLIAALERMDGDARHRLELCVIGSAALILLGMPMRQTGDIDVWRPASRINDAELRRIADLAGLDVNPETEDPDRPYVQLVSRGIVSLPESEGEHWPAGQDRLVLWQGDKLTVSCPPLPVLAAAKLVRASDVDLDDLVYLINAHGVSRYQIEESLTTFPPAQQEQARDKPRPPGGAVRSSSAAPARDQRRKAGMTPREKWVLGSSLLKQLVKDELAVARALRERRWAELAAAAEVAASDADPQLALTDPAQYRTLRDAITIFHVKGYGGLDVAALWARASTDGNRGAGIGDRNRGHRSPADH